MTNFSESALNLYFVSIENNTQAIGSFSSDLQLNFVGAFASRFILSQSDIDTLSNFPVDMKAALINVAIISHQLFQLPLSSSVRITVEGFEAPTSQETSTVLPEVKWYGKAYGSIPPCDNIKWETGVKASWSIC